MLNKVMLSVLFFCLVGCGDPDWMLQGSNHGLDRQEWAQASVEKQIGTSGYYLRSLQQKGFLKDESVTEGETWFVNASNLTACLNKHLKFSNKGMNHLVADCVNELKLNK